MSIIFRNLHDSGSEGLQLVVYIHLYKKSVFNILNYYFSCRRT